MSMITTTAAKPIATPPLALDDTREGADFSFLKGWKGAPALITEALMAVNSFPRELVGIVIDYTGLLTLSAVREVDEEGIAADFAKQKQLFGREHLWENFGIRLPHIGLTRAIVDSYPTQTESVPHYVLLAPRVLIPSQDGTRWESVPLTLKVVVEGRRRVEKTNNNGLVVAMADKAEKALAPFLEQPVRHAGWVHLCEQEDPLKSVERSQYELVSSPEGLIALFMLQQRVGQQQGAGKMEVSEVRIEPENPSAIDQIAVIISARDVEHSAMLSSTKHIRLNTKGFGIRKF
jgi:hypothetical protein